MGIATTLRWYATWMLASMIGFGIFAMIGFILVGTVTGFFTDDVEGALESDAAFAVVLTVAFALGGTGLGLGQWLHLRRRVRRAGRWIGLMALAFATISITFNAIVLAAGDAHLDAFSGRLANELAHTILTGIFIAWLGWRLLAAVNGGDSNRWSILVASAFPITGLTIWGLEVGFQASGGDVNPFGMLVFGALTAAAWHPLVFAAASAGTARPAVTVA